MYERHVHIYIKGPISMNEMYMYVKDLYLWTRRTSVQKDLYIWKETHTPLCCQQKGTKKRNIHLYKKTYIYMNIYLNRPIYIKRDPLTSNASACQQKDTYKRDIIETKRPIHVNIYIKRPTHMKRDPVTSNASVLSARPACYMSGLLFTCIRFFSQDVHICKETYIYEHIHQETYIYEPLTSNASVLSEERDLKTRSTDMFVVFFRRPIYSNMYIKRPTYMKRDPLTSYASVLSARCACKMSGFLFICIHRFSNIYVYTLFIYICIHIYRIYILKEMYTYIKRDISVYTYPVDFFSYVYISFKTYSHKRDVYIWKEMYTI